MESKLLCSQFQNFIQNPKGCQHENVFKVLMRKSFIGNRDQNMINQTKNLIAYYAQDSKE